MKEKRHLVMWVEVIALAVLLARLETVRIRENAKEVQEYTCAGREQELSLIHILIEINRIFEWEMGDHLLFLSRSLQKNHSCNLNVSPCD